METTKQAVNFVISGILHPRGIEVSAKHFKSAAEDSESVLNDMQLALVYLISSLVFASKEEAKRWRYNTTIEEVVQLIQIMGLKSADLDILSSSKSCLICLLWLIWRYDLIDEIYANIIPNRSLVESFEKENGLSYSPFYKEETVSVSKDNVSLMKKIQRNTGKLAYKLQTLSDIEIKKQILYWKIRDIDPVSPISNLLLKSRPGILEERIKEIKKTTGMSSQLKMAQKAEKIFWNWAAHLLEEADGLEVNFVTKNAVYNPRSLINKNITQIEGLLDSIESRVVLCEEKIAKQQINLPELEDDIERLYREFVTKLELKPRTESNEQGYNLIPDFNLKEFSTGKLNAIIDLANERLRKCSETYSVRLEENARSIANLADLSLHGWSSSSKKDCK